MLTEEQAKEIKTQLINHINSTFPEDKRDSAKRQVEEMSNEQLEEFVKQNNLVKENTNPEAGKQSIYRAIINGQINSYKIDENKYSIAVLEINPISKGHVIIIPQKEVKSVEKIPQPIFSLAKKISKKIKSKLKPKEVKIASSNAFGEFIINIFPVYEEESLNSQRYHAEESELIEVQEKLKKKKVKRVSRRKAEKVPENEIRLPKRIP